MEFNWHRYTSELTNATGTDDKLLHRVAHGAILDIGCGIGKHLANVKTNSVKVGIDAGISGLQKGKRIYSDIQFVCSSAYSLPVKNETFDTVISIDVIEHLHQPDAALQPIYHLLKPGGMLFLQTPNYPVKRLYDLLHVVRGSREKFADDPTHVSKFNSRSLAETLSRAGFKIKQVIARNVMLQKYIPRLELLRNTVLGRAIGQKIIIIAQKGN